MIPSRIVVGIGLLCCALFGLSCVNYTYTMRVSPSEGQDFGKLVAVYQQKKLKQVFSNNPVFLFEKNGKLQLYVKPLLVEHQGMIDGYDIFTLEWKNEDRYYMYQFILHPNRHEGGYFYFFYTRPPKFQSQFTEVTSVKKKLGGGTIITGTAEVKSRDAIYNEHVRPWLTKRPSNLKPSSELQWVETDKVDFAKLSWK